jgi:hypothetical protein
LAQPRSGQAAHYARQRETSRGRCGDGIVGVGPRARGGGGLTAWSGDGGGGEPARARPPVKPHGGSPPGFRFCDRGVVARHGRG